MWYSFENYYVLIILALIFIELNIIGYMKTKAYFPMLSLIIFVTTLIIHSITKDILGEHYIFNATIDLICMGISMVNLFVIDEIEIRREIIKEVFENRYKN